MRPKVEHFSIRDASLVTAPDMDRLRAFAERTRDGTYILQAVLEEAHIIPAGSSQDGPQRKADLAHIQKSARWYQETLFKDYRDKKKGLNVDAVEEIYDQTAEYEASSPILAILGQLAQGLPDVSRSGVYEAERIARIMMLDEEQEQ